MLSVLSQPLPFKKGVYLFNSHFLFVFPFEVVGGWLYCTSAHVGYHINLFCASFTSVSEGLTDVLATVLGSRHGSGPPSRNTTEKSENDILHTTGFFQCIELTCTPT